jgi:hypothetical protein
VHGARSTHFSIPSYAIALLMTMMKPNAFMPLLGAAAKDSCFFVKLRRISVRTGKVGTKYLVSVEESEFPYLLGIMYSGGKSKGP